MLGTERNMQRGKKEHIFFKKKQNYRNNANGEAGPIEKIGLIQRENPCKERNITG